MSFSWKKLILWVALIALLLMAFSAWKLQRTQNQLEVLFQSGLAPTDTTGGVRADRVRLSVMGGEVAVFGMHYFSRTDALEWQTEVIRVRIGTWKSLQMGLLPAPFVIGRLKKTVLQIEGAQTSSAEIPTRAPDIQATLHGSPFLLFSLLGERRFPPGNVRLTAESSAIDPATLIGISGLMDNEAMSDWVSSLVNDLDGLHMTADMEINRQNGRLIIHYVTLKSADGDFSSTLALTGEYYNLNSNNATDRLLYPNLVEVNFSGTFGGALREAGFKLNASSRISAERFAWTLTSQGNPGDSLTIASMLTSPDRTRIEIVRPVLFPAAGFLGPVEQFLILFGVPVNRFDFIAMSADYEYGRDGVTPLKIHQAELTHPNFRLYFDGEVQRIDGEFGARSPVRGELRLDQMTQGLRNASQNLEDLFGLRFNRDGDAILFPVGGTLGAPSVF
jgi:hypothetical protein